jgi:hypothetical protein
MLGRYIYINSEEIDEDYKRFEELSIQNKKESDELKQRTNIMIRKLQSRPPLTFA